METCPSWFLFFSRFFLRHYTSSWFYLSLAKFFSKLLFSKLFLKFVLAVFVELVPLLIIKANHLIITNIGINEPALLIKPKRYIWFLIIYLYLQSLIRSMISGNPYLAYSSSFESLSLWYYSGMAIVLSGLYTLFLDWRFSSNLWITSYSLFDLRDRVVMPSSRSFLCLD
jgi:hypothetical protein